MSATINRGRPFGRAQRWAGEDLPPARWTGVGVENRAGVPFSEIVNGWRRSARAAEQVLSSGDTRWALVSTSVTALIAGSVAWLALGLMPESHPYGAHDRTLMPYQLFLKLAGRTPPGRLNFAGLTPGGSVVESTPTLGVAPASLDQRLADERGGRDENSGMDTRTVTLDRGDTLVGALTDAGVSQQEANAVILALARVYDPKAVRAGESFDISFTTIPDQPIAQITYTPPGQAAPDPIGDDGSTGLGNIENVPAMPVGKLLSLTYSPAIDHDITISRSTGGLFTAQDVHKTLRARNH